MRFRQLFALVLLPSFMIGCADATSPDRTDGSVDVVPDASMEDAAPSVDAAFPACDLELASRVNCSECQQCAYAGRCSAEAAACEGHVECAAILECVTMCPSNDRPCFAACEQQHPEGVSRFSAVYACVACRECSVSCQGRSYCP